MLFSYSSTTQNDSVKTEVVESLDEVSPFSLPLEVGERSTTVQRAIYPNTDISCPVISIH